MVKDLGCVRRAIRLLQVATGEEVNLLLKGNMMGNYHSRVSVGILCWCWGMLLGPWDVRGVSQPCDTQAPHHCHIKAFYSVLYDGIILNSDTRSK